MALANHLLHTFGGSGQFRRYAVSILPCTVKLQIGDEQGAEETLCSEPRRRSVQNRAGGRGAAGDLRERTKRAGAASRLRVQCLSERPSISRWQRALRERRGHGTGRLKRLGIGNVPVNLPPLRIRGFGPMGRDGGIQPMRSNLDGRWHPAAAAESSCPNTPAYTHAPGDNEISEGLAKTPFSRQLQVSCADGRPETAARDGEAGRGRRRGRSMQ